MSLLPADTARRWVPADEGHGSDRMPAELAFVLVCGAWGGGRDHPRRSSTSRTAPSSPVRAVSSSTRRPLVNISRSSIQIPSRRRLHVSRRISILPKALESIAAKLGIAHGVRDVPVPRCWIAPRVSHSRVLRHESFRDRLKLIVPIVGQAIPPATSVLQLTVGRYRQAWRGVRSQPRSCPLSR